LTLACRPSVPEVAEVPEAAPDTSLVTSMDAMAADTAILTDSGGVTILRHQGGSIPVSPTAVHGYLDHAGLRGDSVLVSGWAADTIARTLADSVLVVLGGQAPRLVGLSVERGDLEEHFESPALRLAGFTFAVPSSALTSADALRVFAFEADSVSELRHTQTFVVPTPSGSAPGDSVGLDPVAAEADSA
jgi:hypothetical protein